MPSWNKDRCRFINLFPIHRRRSFTFLRRRKRAREMVTSGDILSLPVEVRDIIVSHLSSAEDLKNVKLACSAFRFAADRRLFRVVRWTPDTKRQESYNNIADRLRISTHVRKVIIETLPNLDQIERLVEHRSTRPEWEASRDAAIDALRCSFPRASEVEIKFSASNIRMAPGYVVCQSEEERENIMGRLMNALSRRTSTTPFNSDQHSRAIRKFTAVNLLSWQQATSSKAIQDLTEINLSVRVHRKVVEVDLDKLRIALKSFRKTWLEPSASKITSLSLYLDSYWGAIPFVSMADLRFPNLTKLLLGNYAFLYPSQIAWLVSLKSVQCLSLDDCPIVYVMHRPSTWIENCNSLLAKGLMEHELLEFDHSHVFINKARWHQYFERIGQELPNLMDFRCGHGNWERLSVSESVKIDGFVSITPFGTVTKAEQMEQAAWLLTLQQRNAFESRHDLAAKIHSTRYVVFLGRSDMLVNPIWAEVENDHTTGDEMDEIARWHLQCSYRDAAKIPTLPHEGRVKDEEALASLLKIIGQRATA